MKEARHQPRQRLQCRRPQQTLNLRPEPHGQVLSGLALSPLTRPSPFPRRVGIRIFTFEAGARALAIGASYCWRAFATAVANVLEGTASEEAAPSCFEPATRMPMISGSLPPKRRSAEPDSPGTELQL